MSSPALIIPGRARNETRGCFAIGGGASLTIDR